MREDMDRVIIERPRARGGARRPKGERKELRRQLSQEDTPVKKKQPLRDRWLGQLCRKEFTDLLGPLKNYAQSVVGRKWDDVHSEVCKVLSPRSMMAKHAADHLWDFIIPPEKVIISPDGKAYEKSNYRGRFMDDLPGFRIGINKTYVDPRDGVIKRGWARYNNKPCKPKYQTVNVGGRHFRKWEGIWYEVFMAEIPACARNYTPSRTEELRYGLRIFRPGFNSLIPGLVVDILLGDLAVLGAEKHVLERLRGSYGVEKYAYGRKQINSRQIRQLGLRSRKTMDSKQRSKN
jgi:hypothetical protein